MTANLSTISSLPLLEITCTSTDCENGLHCYLQKQKLSAQSASGPCRDCGVDLVNWDRVHTRNLADVAHTFAALKSELIRHHFWHVPIDEDAVNHARRKGRLKMREAAIKRLRQSIGPAKPWRDGAQTSKKGNALFYAQHATATCCRKCVEEWHGIPQGQQLTEQELEYLAELVNLYVEERLPFLTEEGEKIPNRRQRLVMAERQKRQSGTRVTTTSNEHDPPVPSASSAEPLSNNSVAIEHQQLLEAVRRKQKRGEQ